ncbi:MAG: LysM peptidoglycan-binding domain-containing protein [Planctomycetota bacterium]|nr:LysM peptidoglycan-binding domain-containing protein [Planctomycetota bacterium]
MSGSAKIGLLGVLLMIVFVAVVWDRGNEEDVQRQATEIIAIPEPNVLSSRAIGDPISKAAAAADSIGGETHPKEERIADPLPPIVKVEPSPPSSTPEPDRERLEKLAEALFSHRPVSAPPRSVQPAAPAPAGAAVRTVRDGESLWTIAKEIYGDGERWRSLYDANRVRISNPDRLVAGTRLVLPGAQRTTRSRSTRSGFYVVRDGDTLYGIARSLLGKGVLWEQLLEENRDRIDDPDRLVPGTRLVIPSTWNGANTKP